MGTDADFNQILLRTGPTRMLDALQLLDVDRTRNRFGGVIKNPTGIAAQGMELVDASLIAFDKQVVLVVLLVFEGEVAGETHVRGMTFKQLSEGGIGEVTHGLGRIGAVAAQERIVVRDGEIGAVFGSQFYKNGNIDKKNAQRRRGFELRLGIEGCGSVFWKSAAPVKLPRERH